MKIEFTNKKLVKYLQEGGQMAAEPAATEPAAPVAGQGDATQELLAACQQALQAQDCNMAMQILQAIVQMIGGQQEMAAPEGQPVYKKGGKLAYWKK